MESARSYSSVTKRAAWAYTRNYTGSGRKLKNGTGNGLPGSFLGMGDEDTDAKGSSNAQTTLEDVSLHFQNVSNSDRVSLSSEEKDARENIRQHCMRFLMYLLFGDKSCSEPKPETGLRIWQNTIRTATAGLTKMTKSGASC